MKITKPNRVTRTYKQLVVAEPPAVFPLLCPVREADWIEGWNPVSVATNSGVAEPDCVFVTDASPDSSIWYVTIHDRVNGVVEMLKIAPHVTACRLRIQLRAVGTGSEAEISYTHTSLGPDGDAFVESFTEDYYRQFMQDWEARINHYLLHGSILR